MVATPKVLETLRFFFSLSALGLQREFVKIFFGIKGGHKPSTPLPCKEISSQNRHAERCDVRIKTSGLQSCGQGSRCPMVPRAMSLAASVNSMCS